MGRPRRHFEAEAIYRIKNVCTDNEARLRPTPEITKVIMGLLSKFVHRHELEVYGFIFMPHYFELMVRSKGQVIQHFMRDFQSSLSAAIKAMEGRRAPLFSERYSHHLIMEDMHEEVLRELISAPVSLDFVSHPAEWPGASSWGAHQSGERVKGGWAESEDYWTLRRSSQSEGKSDQAVRDLAATPYSFALARLPAWEELSQEAYAQKLARMPEEAMKAREARWEAAEEGADPQAAPPGLRELKALSARDIIAPWVPLRRGGCITRDPARLKAYQEAHKARNKRYDRAARRLRRGAKDAYFPAGMIPPGHLYCVGSRDAIRYMTLL